MRAFHSTLQQLKGQHIQQHVKADKHPEIETQHAEITPEQHETFPFSSLLRTLIKFRGQQKIFII
jgi:hypothetical protein